MTYVRKPTCSKCGGEIEDNRKGKFSYCRKCHTEYGRLNRKKHSERTEEQRKRANARAYAKVYLERGKLTKQPCVVCGCDDSEMHHPNYSKPLFVVWLCRGCHEELHLLLIEEMKVLFRKQLQDIKDRIPETA